MLLEGKKVLVTGGALRVGRAISQGFARRGAEVLVHYHRSKKEAASLMKEFKAAGVKATFYQADFSDFKSLEKFSKKVLKDTGGVDILVNSASAFLPGRSGKVTESDWDRHMAVNFKAPFFLSQALGPTMKKKGEGRIINIADLMGLHPATTYLAHSLSKSGLFAMTEALAKALAPDVLVTAVCPGPVLAPPGMTKKQKTAVKKGILVDRWGTPEDVVKTVLFLAESDYATGTYYRIDGGARVVN
jgi:NAD(P)-dependent dehydrogenase (short-subunit alcohol dehydrogenase family)